MGAIPIVTIPHPLADNGPEEVARKAQAIAREVVAVLTEPAEKLAYDYGSRFVKGGAQRSSATIQVEDSLEAVNQYFFEHELSDGLPIVPPTPERVAAMLKWIDRAPSDTLGVVPPRDGEATIEKLAINAVMAGCAPEYFPVIVTAVQAMLQERFNLYALQTTTHPCAPMLVLNGPIAREIGVNSRYNVFGPGWRANATIGRAIRLILLNISAELFPACSIMPPRASPRSILTVSLRTSGRIHGSRSASSAALAAISARSQFSRSRIRTISMIT
jgi:hypothetical protein